MTKGIDTNELVAATNGRPSSPQCPLRTNTSDRYPPSILPMPEPTRGTQDMYFCSREWSMPLLCQGYVFMSRHSPIQ